MRTLLPLPLLVIFFPPTQNPANSDGSSAVMVLGFKWSRARQTIEKTASAMTAPAPTMIGANKNYERQRRGNDPAGVRDPNADTLDGRSAALERSVQESRSPKSVVDGFAYRAKFQNASTKVIEIRFWEYQFMDPSNPSTVSRRQFLCGVNMKPGKEKELQGFSLSGPSDVISGGTLAQQVGKPFSGEGCDQSGGIRGRVNLAAEGLEFRRMRLTYAHAMQTPWAPDTCKGL